MARDLPPAIVILGETAVGKTTVSIELAEAFNGEIINVDASAFYRGMDIGTAKPTPAERDRVRHHLIDIADPDEVISLGRFKRLADAAMDDITTQGKVPFIVGGSGQYIHAIVKNYRIPEAKPDPVLREKLRQRAEEVGNEAFHAELAAIDPEAAAKIHPNNVRRVIRALEVYHITGEPISAQKGHGPQRYDFCLIGLERDSESLYARIDRRIDWMLEHGFIGEVRALLAAGYPPTLRSMAAIGYREIVAHLRGELTLDEVREQMQQATRRLARHQRTWFSRDDMDIQWVPAENPYSPAHAHVKDFLTIS